MGSASSETVKGLVIREVNFGDNDKLLTLLTEQHGKMTVRGCGVRSHKNKNFAASQLFSYGTYVIAKRKNGGDYIKEADLEENFFALRENLVSLAFASYICELANYISGEENSDEPFLRLVLNTLWAESHGEATPGRTKKIKASFELRCACALGFSPELSACSVCGRRGGAEFYLDILGGALLCPDCVSKTGHADREGFGGWTRPLVRVSEAAVDAMRYVTRADDARFLSFSLPEPYMDEFANACERYLLGHIGRGFATLDYYKQFEKL